MPNPKGNPATLKSYVPKWNSGVTRTIRVPVALADKILDYAHKLDDNSPTQVNDSAKNELPAIAIASQDENLTKTLTQVIDSLKQVTESPSARFTKAMKQKIQQQISLLETLIQVK